MKLSPLNRREATRLLENIEKQFSCDLLFMLDIYFFFMSERNKVQIVSRDIQDVVLEGLRVNSFGLYFCEINHEEIRLSIEGSQIVGPFAKKKVHDLTEEETRSWMKGNDLPCKTEYSGFVMVRSNGDYLGCGKYKEEKLLNFVPKVRRVSLI